MNNGLYYELERIQLCEDWAKYTAQRLQKSIARFKIGASGSLNYSILYQLMGISGGDVGSIKHEFNYYGKFVDMGVGRGTKIESVMGNADIISLIGGKSRRPKRWLSKTYYAEVAELSSLLSAKYGDQYTNIIKEQITKSV